MFKMSDVDFSAVDRRSEPIAPKSSEIATERVLVVRPESFFSHRFHMHVEDQQVEERQNRPSPVRPSGLDRLIDLNLLMLVVFVGVPVLVYCILSTAR